MMLLKRACDELVKKVNAIDSNKILKKGLKMLIKTYMISINLLKLMSLID